MRRPSPRAFLALVLLAGACTRAAGPPAASRPGESEPSRDPDGASRDGALAQAQEGSEGPVASAGPDDDGEDEDAFDDSLDVEPPPDATIAPPHPFSAENDADLEQRLLANPESLGSMSIGKPNAGILVSGMAMPEGNAWKVVAPGQSWGTEETIASLTLAIEAVARAHPDTPRLSIGDISARSGGYLPPHKSHQTGRDVDVGYYYRAREGWYWRANATNLDVERTWAFVRALVTLTDVEMLLIDRGIQKLLREHADRRREDREWLDLLFRGRGTLPPLIRHARGHATHLHVRFYSPTAQETGRRLYAALVRHGKVRPGAAYFAYVAKKGDTLAKIAKRYGTTAGAIRRANGLRSSLIQAKKSYRIPRTGHAPPSVVGGPVKIPPRRLPPDGAGPSGPVSVRSP